MILQELMIYSIREKRLLKKYTFNEVGLNIIIGEKKDKSDEANGVGKTTMVECLSFLLGSEIEGYYKNNKVLIEKDIVIFLKVLSNEMNIFLGRHFNSSQKGYILFNKEISYDLSEWKALEDSDYKAFIHDEIIGKDITDISFAALREYIIRDEQNGFIKNSLGIANRSASQQYKALAFLSGLNYDAESEIKKVSKNILKLKDEQNALLSSTNKKVSSLKAEKAKYSSVVKKLEKDIKSINLNKQYNFKAEDYNIYKQELNSIQSEIFKLLHVKKQYEQNINNLKKKSEDIKLLGDIEPFYEQLIGLFPEKIKHNYNEIKEFYDFMVDNRGKYYQDKVDKVNLNLNRLNLKKVELEKDLEESYKLLKNSDLIDDINTIIAEREKLNTSIAEINIQLKNHQRIKELNNDINILKGKKSLLIQRKTDEFNSFSNRIEKLENTFQQLSEIAYETPGILNIEFDNNVNDRKDATTGRVKFECKLPDDRSHGINYMKINMFDLSWFLNALEREYINLDFLIHDGSYSKPNPSVKAKVLKDIDDRLIKLGKGQYFVTLNKDELHHEDIKHFDENGNLTVKLNRGNNDLNRFFGFKLYE
mgnify:CR=1 FL=1